MVLKKQTPRAVNAGWIHTSQVCTTAGLGGAYLVRWGWLFEPLARHPAPALSTGPGGFFLPPPHSAGQGAPRPLTAQHEEQHAGQGGHDHQQGQPDALPHAARSPPAPRAAPRACGAGGGPKRAGGGSVAPRRSAEQRRGGP